VIWKGETRIFKKRFKLRVIHRRKYLKDLVVMEEYMTVPFLIHMEREGIYNDTWLEVLVEDESDPIFLLFLLSQGL
jgi:hypothetical protein